MAKAKNQYTIRKIHNGFNVVKCDSELNPIEIYTVQEERGRLYCSCPNTLKAVCRHMTMLTLFKKKRAVDKGKFYCYDTQEWTDIKG